MTLSTFVRGRTALVTGASSGIGAETARQLGAAGARVVLVARTGAALDAVAADVRGLGGEARTVVADLEAPGAARALVERLGEPVDVLVANAGFGVRATVLETAPEALTGMVMLNV
ncbi:MAG TPA: SDR family NAD(P)-dependent oxidoreductase, partial [Rubricoccaceae bacterium]